jgi:hypothetical protein
LAGFIDSISWAYCHHPPGRYRARINVRGSEIAGIRDNSFRVGGSYKWIHEADELQGIASLLIAT